LLVTGANAASRMYTTTIRDTTIPTVQETIINVFSSKGFAVTDIGPNKIDLNKTFGDGFFLAIRNRTITFTMFPREKDVRVMVTQSELNQGIVRLQNSIDHLIPLIKTVRNQIDRTPLDLIENESVNNDVVSPKEKKHGIVINDKDAEGFYRIQSIERMSGAENAKLSVNDAIIEINGRVMSDYNKEEINTYIDNKWQEGSSLIMLISRDGEQKMITLKKE
jgi:hypothetical protein